MRPARLAAYTLLLALPLTLLARLALGDAPAASRDPQPEPLELLDIADYNIGQLMEGDGPPLEHFAPDAFPAAAVILQDEPIPAPEGYAVDFAHYPSNAEVRDFLDQLEAEYPDLVENLDIGESWEGLPIRAVRLTNEKGAQPISDRPIVYIDAQHHARELIGNQVTLYHLWWLLDAYGSDPVATRVLDTRAIHFIPIVNVDGNRIVLGDEQAMRRTANPSSSDDDGDGSFDEDPREGYGYGTDSLTRYEFDQEWADAHPDDPFVDGWRDHMIGQPQSLGLFTGALGGPTERIDQVDQDGDGRAGEDPIGGTDANRNYDWFWDSGDTNVRSETFRGPAVFSEPETSAVRDYLSELDHIALGLSYHSGVDIILHPWGYSRTDELPDAGMYELLARKGSQLTEAHGFKGSYRTWTAQGLYPGTGSTMDYIYGDRGAFAFSPEVYGGSGTSRLERMGATGVFTVGQATGFNFNPRPEDILPAVERWNRYGRYLMAASPNVELNGLEIVDNALIVTAGSEGILPISLTLSLDGAEGARLALPAPEARPYHNEQIEWSIPLADLARQDNRLRLEAWLMTGTAPHRVERAEWRFAVSPDGGLELLEGELSDYVDLGPAVGGWWAGEEWNDPNYRCPRGIQNCPPQIIATPPAGINLPTAEPTEPVPTTPTAEPPAGAIYLPWLHSQR
jgi:hypothetical protein